MFIFYGTFVLAVKYKHNVRESSVSGTIIVSVHNFIIVLLIFVSFGIILFLSHRNWKWGTNFLCDWRKLP
jgi:hypothetical protein